MKIQWFGQSSFMLTSAGGTRLVTDPFARLTGYRIPGVTADVVTVSHQHMDHNNVRSVRGDFRLVNTTGLSTVGDFTITGVQAWHSANQNPGTGMSNVVFIFEADGLRIAHTGDIGHLLTPMQLAAIGHVDILLLPVGGGPMVSVEEAEAIRRQLNPRIVIPMHYRTPATGLVGLMFKKPDVFLTLSGLPWKAQSVLDITAGSLPETPSAVILDYRARTKDNA